MTSSPGAASAPAAHSGRRVLLAGASGLVGRELLRALLDDPAVATVHAVVRRRLPLQHPRLVQHEVDFSALLPLPQVDEAFIALGTTIKVAGSQPAFRAVDFDAVLAVARAARAAGAMRLGVVSAMGANARSRVFYNRVKGEMEEALAGLGFEALVIARPSLLVGDRERLGQPPRRGEAIGERVSQWLGPLVPRQYRPIAAGQVARALLQALPDSRGVRVMRSGEMQDA